jgi:nucleosome binding factor SPN SPT16 subunit
MIEESKLSKLMKSEIRKVNDLKKSDSMRSEDEIQRCKLAAAYRLVDTKGLSWSIYNQITVRSASNPNHFFTNPYGLYYNEISASTLLKIDSKCNFFFKFSFFFY